MQSAGASFQSANHFTVALIVSARLLVALSRACSRITHDNTASVHIGFVNFIIIFCSKLCRTDYVLVMLSFAQLDAGSLYYLRTRN